MSVEECVHGGSLSIPWCNQCLQHLWPPSRICRTCGGKTVLKPSSGQGRILEYSSDGDGYFCLVEFEGDVRLLCRLIGDGIPKPETAANLVKCGMDKTGCFFDVQMNPVISK